MKCATLKIPPCILLRIEVVVMHLCFHQNRVVSSSNNPTTNGDDVRALKTFRFTFVFIYSYDAL